MEDEDLKMKNAKDLKRALDLQIAQRIREFELTTGFMVNSKSVMQIHFYGYFYMRTLFAKSMPNQILLTRPDQCVEKS